MSPSIQEGQFDVPGRPAKWASMVAARATLMIGVLLHACGGGDGGGGNSQKNAQVISEALIPDGASSCSVEAEVYTGPNVVHDAGGTCSVFVDFALFDPSGNQMNVQQPLYALPPRQTFNFHLHICSGQGGLSMPGVGEFPTGSPALFLLPDVDRCPSGTTIDVPTPDTHLVRPPQEVSCQTIGRVHTTVTPCS